MTIPSDPRRDGYAGAITGDPSTDPHRLSDADLLAWEVVLGYREQQQRDGMRLLLLPFPPCPTCTAIVREGTVSWVREVTREEVTIDLRPCGHSHWAPLRAVEDLQDHVAAMSEALRHRLMTVEEIVSEAHARLGQPETVRSVPKPTPAVPAAPEHDWRRVLDGFQALLDAFPAELHPGGPAVSCRPQPAGLVARWRQHVQAAREQYANQTTKEN